MVRKLTQQIDALKPEAVERLNEAIRELETGHHREIPFHWPDNGLFQQELGAQGPSVTSTSSSLGNNNATLSRTRTGEVIDENTVLLRGRPATKRRRASQPAPQRKQQKQPGSLRQAHAIEATDSETSEEDGSIPELHDSSSTSSSDFSDFLDELDDVHSQVTNTPSTSRSVNNNNNIDDVAVVISDDE